MVVGVGIDTVRISEMERLCDDAFARYTFTQAEREFAARRMRPAEAFAGMFAKMNFLANRAKARASADTR